MKIVKALAISAALTAYVGSAYAQDDDAGAYVNVGVDTLDFDTFGVGAKLGYNFTKNFGLEAQGSIGVIDDEVVTFGQTVDVGYDYIAGGFFTVSLPLGRDVSWISRFGYYTAEATATTGNVSASASTDGFAGGSAIQYMFGEKDGIRVDYTYLDDGGDTGSIAYVRKF